MNELTKEIILRKINVMHCIPIIDLEKALTTRDFEDEKTKHSIRKPFGFVHNINDIYFTFSEMHWFYNNPGYTDDFIDKNGWKFDGQVFYKMRNARKIKEK